MGQLLDQWMAANTAALARLQPGGGMPSVGGPPPPAFPTGAGAEMPPGQQAFPQAAAVQVQDTPGAQVGEFGPYQAPSMPAFPEEAMAAPAGGGGPGPGSMVMDAIDARRAEATEGGPETFGAEDEQPVEEEEPTGDEEVRMPEEGEAFSAQDAMRQTPEAVDKAADLLEEQTGESVEQHYEKVTGNPPPANQNRRRTAEFLFEFGLNLLAQPGGMSPAQEFGQAAQQTMAGRASRRQTTEAARLEAASVKHQRGMDLAELGLKRREVEAVEAGEIQDFIGMIDGKPTMMKWNPATNTAEPVLGPDGLPVELPPDTETGTETEAGSVYSTTFAGFERIAEIYGEDFKGTDLEVQAIREATAAMRKRDTAQPLTDDQMMDWATEQATEMLKSMTFYTDALPEEQPQMMQDTVDSFFNLKKYHTYQTEAPPMDLPDANRLPEGMAVEVTDEHGRTAWFRRETDAAGNATARRLSPEEARRLTQ